MPAKSAPREHAKAIIDDSIRRAISRNHGSPDRRFIQLLGEVRGRSDLLRPTRYRGRIDAGWLDSILGALLALLDYRRDWLRPVATWEPAGAGPIPLFSSLVHHLLAEYPVPPVLLSGWFAHGYEGRVARRWFLRAGAGISLREVGFPVSLTRRMAHDLALAPAHYPIGFALRWAQARGLGGSDRAARAVAGSVLGQHSLAYRDDFWTTLIQFVVNHPDFPLARLDGVVAYLDARKFAQQPALIGAGDGVEVDLDPPEPDLTLKGWTVASLLRRVDEWQARGQPATPDRAFVRWDRSGIGEYRGDDLFDRTWTIRELLDSDALAAEGEAMDHCVATYTAYCAKRLATIWSVGVEVPDWRERSATVEVDPATRRVVQAKGRTNCEPDDSCRWIIRRWVDREGLAWDE